MTNFEKIKQMNIQETAAMLRDFCKCSETCAGCPFSDDCPESELTSTWERWLKNKAKNSEDK